MKSTKAEAHYRDYRKDGQWCAKCTMFRKPGSCTAVAGEIEPQGWCKLYEEKDR